MTSDQLSLQIRENLHDAVGLISVLQSAMEMTGPTHAHRASELLGGHHGPEWNLFTAIRDAVLSKVAGGFGYRYLVAALAHVSEVSAQELCGLARDMRSESHWNGWVLHDPVLVLFRRDRALCMESLKLVLSQRKEFTDDDVITFATAMGLAQPAAAFEYLLCLCRSSSENDRQAALIGLRAIADSGNLALLMQATGEIRQIAEQDCKGSAALASAAWDMISRLCLVDSQARQLIERAAREGPKVAHTAICLWLSRRPLPPVPDELVLSLFSLLLGAAINSAESRPDIGGTLALLLQGSPLKSAMFDLCDALNVPSVQFDLQIEFPSLFAALIQTSETFAKVMSRWLLSPSFSTSSLQSLLQAAYLNPALVAPETAMFAAADLKTRRRAVSRLLGLTVQAGPVCQLVFYLGEASQLQPWGVEIFEEIFTNYMLVEFPDSARDFLSEKQKSLDPQNPLACALARVLKAINDWDEVLKSLPEANELRPSADKQDAIRAAYFRQQRAMSKDIEAKSIWRQIATPLRVKQGRRVISRAVGRAPQAIEMKTHVHNVKFPASEIADPLWSRRLRLFYLGGG